MEVGDHRNMFHHNMNNGMNGGCIVYRSDHILDLSVLLEDAMSSCGFRVDDDQNRKYYRSVDICRAFHEVFFHRNGNGAL
ncbi:MAG: hypothetical protein Q8S57_07035 [Methanoregula sp.]|nr:hypothetical protein [Methanoregula sp.]